MDEAKGNLLEELSSGSLNFLRIRDICRDNPGVIASAGLRIRIWTLLLLGETDVNDNLDLDDPDRECGEQHVLLADVKRTRSDIELFRSVAWRNAVMKSLQVFCITHNIEYKQGMNEIYAPFLFINPPPKGLMLSYRLFEAFLYRYLERYFLQDDSAYLFRAFRLFHLLLLYHDPQLACHLRDQEFPPELYAPQWFMTLYSRGLPLHLVLRLWDMVIAVDDPAFTFFIGLCILRRRRSSLLVAAVEAIPETIANMHQIHEESDIDSIVSEAAELYHQTPRCFIRCLRLCCVSTPELAPAPWSNPSVASSPKMKSPSMSTRERERSFVVDDLSANSLKDLQAVNVWAVQEKYMVEQAARGCTMVSAKELVSALCPTTGTEISGEFINGVSPTPTSSVKRRETTQYVIIDIRSSEEIIDSGGGMLPRAVNIEPELLHEPDTLENWLQHFDGTRGCSICIIDMPPGKVEVALWRRLLLGEGDGVLGSLSASDSASSWLSSSSQSQHSRTNGTAKASLYSDNESEYTTVETAAKEDDKRRSALHLATVLQRDGFPQVSVLDGGFPALIRELERSRGGVEPVVIHHNPSRWEEYLRSTGREVKDQQKNSDKKSKFLDADSSTRSFEFVTKSDAENMLVGLRAARRLGHSYMEAVLRDKLQNLGINLNDI